MVPPAGAAAGPGDRIEVRGLRALGVHGVLVEERGRAQPFDVDLDVGVDTITAASSDDLADTVDYGAVVEQAAAVVEGRSFQLLEALAAAVAGAVLGCDPRITEVAATVRKVRPPLAVDLASVGVRVVRRRA
jgi:dihydroneopterin aldolase